LSKPISATPLRDAFEGYWKQIPGGGKNKEAAFGLFMAGVHVMLFVVPAEAEDLAESLACVQAARAEVEAYGRLQRKERAEQN